MAGFICTALLSVGTDAFMHARGIFPPPGEAMSDGLFALATAYRLVFTVLGGYMTAALAPRAPMTHVVILGTMALSRPPPVRSRRGMPGQSSGLALVSGSSGRHRLAVRLGGRRVADAPTASDVARRHVTLTCRRLLKFPVENDRNWTCGHLRHGVHEDRCPSGETLYCGNKAAAQCSRILNRPGVQRSPVERLERLRVESLDAEHVGGAPHHEHFWTRKFRS